MTSRSSHAMLLRMNGSSDVVLLTIIVCEVSFWVLVIAGLTLRYVAHVHKLSSVVLSLVPVTDVILIGAVALDLYRGGDVGFAHRLAGIYLGCTIMFGRNMIRWADARFAYRFDGAPAPQKTPKQGPERVRKEWVDFGRWLGAAGIAAAITMMLGYTVANEIQRISLEGIFGPLGIVTLIWFITGPLWVTGKSKIT